MKPQQHTIRGRTRDSQRALTSFPFRPSLTSIQSLSLPFSHIPSCCLLPPVRLLPRFFIFPLFRLLLRGPDLPQDGRVAVTMIECWIRGVGLAMLLHLSHMSGGQMIPLLYLSDEPLGCCCLPSAASVRAREMSSRPVRNCPARVRAIPGLIPCPTATP